MKMYEEKPPEINLKTKCEYQSSSNVELSEFFIMHNESTREFQSSKRENFA